MTDATACGSPSVADEHVRGQPRGNEGVSRAGRIDGLAWRQWRHEMPGQAGLGAHELERAALAVGDQHVLAGPRPLADRRRTFGDVLAAQSDRVGAMDDRAVLEGETDHFLARMKPTQQALGSEGHEGRGREGSRPLFGQLARDRRQQRGMWRAPVAGSARQWHTIAGGERELLAPCRRAPIVEDGAAAELHELNLDAGRTKRVELACGGRLFIDADQGSNANSERAPRPWLST